MKNFKIGDILKPVIVLTIICAVTSGLLAYTNSLTADVIDQNKNLEEDKAKAEVLSGVDTFTDMKSGDISYSLGKDANGEIIGYVFSSKAKGYGGDVKTMVGIDTEGKVTGVRTLDLNETPGLGMNAEKGDWLKQFVGKVKGIAVNKNNPGENEIQALTGATITSKAVTAAVNTALENYETVTGGADNG